jgi:hypothetical protein
MMVPLSWVFEAGGQSVAPSLLRWFSYTAGHRFAVARICQFTYAIHAWVELISIKVEAGVSRYYERIFPKDRRQNATQKGKGPPKRPFHEIWSG